PWSYPLVQISVVRVKCLPSTRMSRSSGRNGGTPCGGECDRRAAVRYESCRNDSSRIGDSRGRVPNEESWLGSLPATPLQVGEAHAIAFWGLASAAGTSQHGTLHRRRHGAADQSVEPVVVAPLGAH